MATYEEIVDSILTLLANEGAFRHELRPTPWSAFLRLSDVIHDRYEIPSTTVTPIMRRMLFAIGFAARPEVMAGVGTYVGYAFSWLLRDRTDSEAEPFPELAFGIETDQNANTVARRNCMTLGHGERLRFVDCDGVTAIRDHRTPLDLLYLDLDDPLTGKADYRNVLEAAIDLLKARSLVLAHDASVPRFKADIETYHRFIHQSGVFDRCWVLPVDACGLSLAVTR